MRKILITGACGFTSRSIVRSIKSSTFRKSNLIGVGIFDNKYELYANNYDKLYKVPRYNSDDYSYRINDILSIEKPDCAIVVPELEVAFWSNHNFSVLTCLPPPQFCNICISKNKLYEVTNDTGLIPQFFVFNGDNFDECVSNEKITFPLWIRDCEEGNCGGKSALKINSIEEIIAWRVINKYSKNIQMSEYLPGNNYACCLLFKEGKLLKYVCAQRIKYFMAHLHLSGISGNTSYGKLINNDKVVEVSLKIINSIIEKTGETMNGLVTVDLKEDLNCIPKVTEINLRHVGFTSSFTSGGVNMVENQLFSIFNEEHLIPRDEKKFPPENGFFRDIDGVPIYVDDCSGK